MSLHDLTTVALRLCEDAKLRELLKSWPDEVCASYALSDDDVVALQDGDCDALIKLGLKRRLAARVSVAVRYDSSTALASASPTAASPKALLAPLFLTRTDEVEMMQQDEAPTLIAVGA